MAFGDAPIEKSLGLRSVEGNDEIRVQAAKGARGTVTVHALDYTVRAAATGVPELSTALFTLLGLLISVPSALKSKRRAR